MFCGFTSDPKSATLLCILSANIFSVGFDFPAQMLRSLDCVEKTEYWCLHEKLAVKQVNFSSVESLVNSTTNHAK